MTLLLEPKDGRLRAQPVFLGCGLEDSLTLNFKLWRFEVQNPLASGYSEGRAVKGSVTAPLCLVSGVLIPRGFP